MNLRRRVRRVGLVLTAGLAGGSVVQTCEVRLRDAVVFGTRNYISTLLDPTNVLQLLLESSADEVATDP